MAKTKISEFSATPGNNTDIDGINIAEGCAPSGINDAIRELMSQLKDFQTGSAGDSFNGPVGTTTAAAGAFTTLSASSTTTLSGLTASTALALDASKNVVSVTNTGTGNNVLSASPTLTGTVAGASLQLSSLTSGRVTYAGTSGLLQDSANLLYSGTDLTVYGITVGRGAGALAGNTALGYTALAGSNSGSGANTAVGYEAMYSNTTGTANTVVGFDALYYNTSGSYNTAIGRNALTSNTTANNNTAVGYQAGYSNTTGTGLVAVGALALYTNTTGVANTAVGAQYTGVSPAALAGNTSGSYNVAIGTGALYANTTANYGTAVGYQAGYSITTTNGLTAFGYQAAYATNNGTNAAFGRQALTAEASGSGNTALGNYNLLVQNGASNNTAVGYSVMTSNTTGGQNTAVGVQALNANTTGGYSTAVGMYALYSNTTADNNTAVGYQAGYSNTTGTSFTSLGYQAGYNSTATNNTFLGAGAGYGTTSGGGNTCVGAASGYALTTGQGNTFIGGAINGATDASGRYITTGSKNTILGCYSGNQNGVDIRTASNYIVLSDGDGNPRGVFDNNGNLKVNATGNYTSITVNSTGTIGGGYFAVQQNSADCGFFGTKGDVLGNSNKDIAIFAQSSLGIYTYTNNGTAGPYIASSGTSWTNSSDERLKNITGEIQNGLSKVCALRAAEFTWKSDESAKQQVGLIAQDVQAVLPEAVSQSVQSKDDPTEYLGVSYTEVIPLLVAAIKELKSELDSVKAELATLKGN